jgi:cysteine-rich repeat protein
MSAPALEKDPMTRTRSSLKILAITPLLALVQSACKSECGRSLDEICDTTFDASSSSSDSDPTSSSSADSSTSSSTSAAVTTDPSTSSTDSTTDTSSDPSTSAPLPSCGDGILDPGEECDHALANADDAPCTSSCSLNICGDGLLLKSGDSPEECDHALANADDAPCTSSCSLNICGDGLLLKSGDSPEECDDANSLPHDGCSPSCLIERLVFVSSIERKGNSSDAGLKSLSGADSLCQNLAQAAGLPPHTYMAWLSTKNLGPSSRFPSHTSSAQGPFLLIDHTPIALSWQDLTDGLLLHPIDLDEHGQTITKSTVWTNTSPSGAPADNGDCDAWNSSEGNPNGGIGYTDTQSSEWTDAKANDCASSARIYCFQVTP